MARNGSGTFSPSVNFVTEAASAPIEISKLDTAIKDLGDEVTNSIAADGQTSPSADLPMNGKKHTNVGAATALNQYARVQELIDQDHVYYVDSGSANTYVITPDPSISAYEEGQRFVFRATTANSGASTLNVNSLGAIAIQTPDGQALASGAIVAGGYYEVTYDANPATDRWVLTSMPSKIPNAMLNTGTGNGLDADKLDGSEGSAFAKLASQPNFTSGVVTKGSVSTPGASFGQMTFLDVADSVGRTGSFDFDDSTYQPFAIEANTISFNTTSASSPTARATIDEDGVFKYGGIEIGFRGVPQVSKSANYTAAIGDSGKHLYATASLTFTIPANSSVAYAVGTVLTFINQSGSSITISITTDTLTLAGVGSTGSRTLADDGIATAIKVSSTSWLISGAGLS